MKKLILTASIVLVLAACGSNKPTTSLSSDLESWKIATNGMGNDLTQIAGTGIKATTDDLFIDTGKAGKQFPSFGIVDDWMTKK